MDIFGLVNENDKGYWEKVDGHTLQVQWACVYLPFAMQ